MHSLRHVLLPLALSLLCSAYYTPPRAAFILPPVMAVDRSKFRTCQQTSFCRRHRVPHQVGRKEFGVAGPSYAVDPKSIHIRTNVDEKEGQVENDAADGGSSGGWGAALLNSFSGGGSKKDDKKKTTMVDPYFRGSSPLITAILTPDHDHDDEQDNLRYPSLSLHLHWHTNGVVRMRITEPYANDGGAGGGGAQQSASTSDATFDPRWTTDEVVLTQISDVSDNAQAAPLLQTLSSNDFKTKYLPSLDGESAEQYMGWEWSPPAAADGPLSDAAATAVVLRLDLFELHLFQSKENVAGPPMVSLNTDQLFHFEHYRTKSDMSSDEKKKKKKKRKQKRSKQQRIQKDDDEHDDEHVAEEERRRLDAEDEEDEDDEDMDEEEDDADEDDEEETETNNDEKQTTADEEGEAKKKDRHGGKEIVGYWEDGLAIYADGTREERGAEDDDDIDDDDDEEDDDDDEDDEEQLKQEESRRKLSLQKKKKKRNIDTKGMWEESFHSHKDSKPYGPSSVGLDLSFPADEGKGHLYGLPEHASSLRLKRTNGHDREYKEPYRLYNLDVFEYELDEPMALYGHIPLIVSHSKTHGTVGAFWFNPTETFVDITNGKDINNNDEDDEDHNNANDEGDKVAASSAHFISESGIIDLFLLPGPNPHAVYAQYASLTGYPELPPMFALGYHQCRWNYRDERDVYQVHGKFEELDFPYDVLWLDIEHTDGKRYFTWDKGAFPNPTDMQKKLASEGRNMVTIIDPHIKRDGNYRIHKDATKLGLYVKDKEGEKDFDGWCWPGSSSYLDFTQEKVRRWWAEQFAYDKYIGSTPSLFTWNDMNEPSVFNGPEVSMSKDLVNLDGVEHRQWHNVYGMLFHRATAEGLVLRNEGQNERPFVLSRAFFAGSQKYGAIWTGDNAAEWEHLEAAAPMLLSMGVGGLSFVGADVGGFFGDVGAELMTRWMQAGAYQPFFRGHAHHDSKRREPWLFGEETLKRVRKATAARYALLPYVYTKFREAEMTGIPVMRTFWMEYPEEEEMFDTDDQWLFGKDLLIKPVTEKRTYRVKVMFPSKDVWYDVDTMKVMPTDSGSGSPTTLEVDCPIDDIPVYQRGGSIIPRKLRLRRSSQTMRNDPYTLYVALNEEGAATGTLYMDDEHSFDYRNKEEYAMAKFTMTDGSTLENTVTLGDGWTGSDAAKEEAKNRMVERIIFMGVSQRPKKITVSAQDGEAMFTYDTEKKIVVVRKPMVSAMESWAMKVQM